MSSQDNVWVTAGKKGKHSFAQVLKNKSENSSESKHAESIKVDDDSKAKKVEPKILITSDYTDFIPNAFGVKRHTIQDIYNLADKYTEMPEQLKDCQLSCVVGYEEMLKSLQRYEDNEVEKHVKAKAKTIKAELASLENKKETVSEKPWLKGTTDATTISFLKEANTILSKLTASSANVIAPEITTLVQKTTNSLPALYETVNLIISKAIDDSAYYIIYGNMCKTIYDSLNEDDAKTFKNALLTLCQTYYDRYNGILYSNESSSVEIAMTKTNKRSVIHFIGQLFNNDLVPIPVMKFILNDLGYRYPNDEEAVETLIQLIHVVGPKFDSVIKTRIYLSGVFRVLYEWEHSKLLSPRLVLYLHGLRDLRHKEWKARDLEMAKESNEYIKEEEDEDEWEVMDASKKEKKSKKHSKKNKDKNEKNMDPQQVFFRNFWTDLLTNKMIDMAIVSISSLDEETKVKLVASLLAVVPARPEADQKSILTYLNELVQYEGLTNEMIKAGLIESIHNYYDLRRKEFYMLASSFATTFAPYFVNQTLTIEDIFENWKFMDDNEKYLAESSAYLVELLSALLTALKESAPTMYEEILKKRLMTIKTVFPSNSYTYVYISRILKRNNMKLVAGALSLN